jgi:hypothetical protein
LSGSVSSSSSSDTTKQGKPTSGIDKVSSPLTGQFAGVGDRIHNVEGIAKIITSKNGSNSILRLENLKATNGPDLYVYLATDKSASDFVDLGRLKANNGNQNYDIHDTILTYQNMILS